MERYEREKSMVKEAGREREDKLLQDYEARLEELHKSHQELVHQQRQEAQEQLSTLRQV